MRYFMPSAKPWTRRDEIAQRFRNVRSMIYLAWLAAWSDSATFAEVMINSTRSAGDEIIANVKMRGVQMDAE